MTRRRGFSLVELLVVLTLLALATLIVTVRTADSFSQARVEESASAWRRIDAVARTAAQERSVVIRAQADPAGDLVTLSDVSGAFIRSWRLPSSISLVDDTVRPLDRLVYERGAGTEDYRATFRVHGHAAALTIAGATGDVAP